MQIPELEISEEIAKEYAESDFYKEVNSIRKWQEFDPEGIEFD